MARGINKVTLIGNVGADPEIRYLPSGDAVANFSLATSEVWKDKQTGAPKERTDWHRIVVFGKLAEAVVKPLVTKGTRLYVGGALRTRKYQSQGQDRYVTEVIIATGGDLLLLDGKPGNGAPPPATRAPATSAPQPDAPPPDWQAPPPDFDDDIPF